MSSYCAICATPVLEFKLRPLGRNDAMVAVCKGCDEEPARADDGPDRAYESGEGMSSADMRARMSDFLDEHGAIDEETVYRNTMVQLADKTPGWILVRVQRRCALGHQRDRRAAIKSLTTKPWFADVRYLGASNNFFLFERPDPRIAKSMRAESANPLAALEQFRSR